MTVIQWPDVNAITGHFSSRLARILFCVSVWEILLRKSISDWNPIFFRPPAISSGEAPALLLVKSVKSSLWERGIEGSMNLMALSEAAAVQMPSSSCSSNGILRKMNSPGMITVRS